MQADFLRDGRVKLWLSRVEYFHLRILPSEASENLWRRREEFRQRVGITFEEARSLSDEILLVGYELLDVPRHRDSQTGKLHGPTKPRAAGTAWDELPKVEAELSPDGRLSLILCRGELATFANCAEVALQELAPTRSESDENELHSRAGMWSREVETLRDELREINSERRVGEEEGGV